MEESYELPEFIVRQVGIVNAMYISKDIYDIMRINGDKEKTYRHIVLSNAEEVYRVGQDDWIAIINGRYIHVWLTIHFDKHAVKTVLANEPVVIAQTENELKLNMLDEACMRLIEAVKDWDDNLADDGTLKSELKKYRDAAR